MGYANVLFDLDGTLVDTGPIILASMRHATRTVLDREIPDDELMSGVGGGGLAHQMRLIDAARTDELVRVYLDHNVPLHESVEAFPGIEQLLRRLRGNGKRLAVVTAKRRSSVDRVFAGVPIRQHFDAVVTAEETERHKPDPAPLLLALDRLGVDAGSSAYVGDSPFDIQAAIGAGLAAIAVTWGGIHPSERLLA
ncbi:MAG: HAD family hydrolase, partial [Gaiellales bacterium]